VNVSHRNDLSGAKSGHIPVYPGVQFGGAEENQAQAVRIANKGAVTREWMGEALQSLVPLCRENRG